MEHNEFEFNWPGILVAAGLITLIVVVGVGLIASTAQSDIPSVKDAPYEFRITLEGEASPTIIYSPPGGWVIFNLDTAYLVLADVHTICDMGGRYCLLFLDYYYSAGEEQPFVRYTKASRSYCCYRITELTVVDRRTASAGR